MNDEIANCYPLPVHSNERPFPCHFCEQTFKSSSNRSKHERRIHAKERNAMRNAANQQQLNKTAPKVAEPAPAPPPPVLKIKKEPPAVLNTSSDDDRRTFMCDYEGCLSGFKTRSSLRDHQKGEKISKNAVKMCNNLSIFQSIQTTGRISVHSAQVHLSRARIGANTSEVRILYSIRSENSIERTKGTATLMTRSQPLKK